MELKGCLLEGAEEVLHTVLWWWNNDCDKAVKEKRRLYIAKEKAKGTKRGRRFNSRI